jgi:hypothetical protein
MVEHAAEFQFRDILFKNCDVGLHGGKGVVIVFLARHLEQFGRILQARCYAVEHQHHVFERFSFAAQFLGAGGVVPEIRRFGQADDFFQAVFLDSVVKETP